MTATYALRFDAPLSRAQERSLLTALGLCLLVTVFALAWAAVAARVEQSSPLAAPDESSAVTPMGDTSFGLRMETRSVQWAPEDASF